VRFIVAVAALIGTLLVSPASASAGTAVTCAGHRATIVGTSGNDEMFGTPGDDVIAALDGFDAVHGRGGNDIICGGPDGDLLLGDGGNDQLFGGRDTIYRLGGQLHAEGDVLVGGLGNDRLGGGSDSRRDFGRCTIAANCGRDILSWKTATRGVRIDIARGQATAGAERDTFTRRNVQFEGSTFGDVFSGSQYADWISTHGGPDSVLSYEGADRIVVDAGGAGAAARVFSGPGNDKTFVHGSRAIVHAGSGADYIEDSAATANTDQLFGDSGDDTLQARIVPNSPAQRLAGGSGVDTLRVPVSIVQQLDYLASWDMSAGDMTVDLPGGDQVAVTADHFENARFGGLKWTVQGTAGANAIQGQETYGVDFAGLGGDDTYRGSINDDTFDGGAGTDRSLGTSDGNDTCISVEILDYPDCENVS
jgi:hypothetical protein